MGERAGRSQRTAGRFALGSSCAAWSKFLVSPCVAASARCVAPRADFGDRIYYFYQGIQGCLDGFAIGPRRRREQTDASTSVGVQPGT